MQSENDKLKNELEEIKSFLKDYGLKWKGSKADVEGEFNKALLDKQLNAKKPAYNFNLPKEIDLGVIAQRVHELNFTIQKEGKHREVKKGADGIHRLEVTILLTIVFKAKSDGILQERHSFGRIPYVLLRVS